MGDVGRHAQTIAGYRLLEPCGKGGMGAVYRARHVATDALVAVKVLAREGLRSPEMLQAFNDEVGAMASLDHPSIATILDYGTVPRGVEPPLAAGSPFLVMELARGGTLSPQCGRMQWPRTRSVLLAILDALGHAHARGVVHRDLKPANVLLRGARADVVVADFGLAHLLDADTPDEDTSASGTPSFMAPEQWRGDWRSFGPWTDLYALGCLAAALVQRRSPFKRTSPLATMRAHLYEAPADLAPWMPVPDGLDAWIRELVHKDPLQRFACAADAAHALRALAEAPEGPTYGAEDDAAEAPTVVLSQQRARPVEPMEGQWRSRPPPAPITADWRGRRAAAVPSALATASLGLCGLRAVPMVDRHDERNALWQALTQVHRDASSRAVLLTGPSGFGKSRLARWLCERAHETGAAHVLRARWEAMAGPGQGLAAMAMRHLRVQGLAGIELERAVRRWLRERGGGSQLDVVAVIGLLDQEQGRAQAPAERYAAASELLVREAQDRPLVLWLDDLQYSSDALGFAVHLLGQRPVPALIVGTLTDEALAERPVVAAQVAALRAQPGVQALRVGPLPEPSRMELVQRVLAVDDALARRLAERAQGNPLFSIQLLEDWVERGLLTPTPRGFRLAPDAEDDLPADLRAVWRDRVERLLGRQRGDALELAAILGTHVDGAEWLGACLQAGVKPRPDLIERLVSARLAERTDRGLALAHPMLRETLEQRARERGVAQRWHRAAAAHLATLDPWGVSERLGDHLVAAGDLEQALAPLLEGARERQARSDSVLAAAALARRTEAMDRLGLPPEAPERARGWVAESRIDCTSGRVPDGHRKATDALRVLVAAGDDEWACHAANALSYATSRQTGGMPEARRLLLEEALPRAANPEQRAETQHSLAYKSLLLGDTDAAEELMEASMPLLRRSGGNNATAALHLAGLIAQVRGDDRKALAMFEEAAAAMDALGRRASAGILYNSVGDAHRNLGRPRSAVEAFQRSVARFEGLGNPMICFPWINLALLHALEGDADSARAALDQARRHGSESTEGTLQLGIAMNELVLAAMGEDWPEFDRALAVSQRVLEQMSTQERDVVTALLVSADHAQSAGKRARAEAARRLAVPILRAQGRAEEADVLEGELKAAHHAPPGPP